MNETSLSFLERLRSSPDSDPWNRLLDLYGPLLHAWLRRYRVPSSDVDDLIQEILMAVAKDLPRFNHVGRPGAFRAWLKGILVNRLRNYWRARGRRPAVPGDAHLQQEWEQLADPSSELSRHWDREHDLHVARQLLALVEPHFSAATWAAFRRVALEGAAADEVARELGLSVNAVFIAKSRVLSRLREEAQGLVDASANFS